MESKESGSDVVVVGLHGAVTEGVNNPYRPTQRKINPSRPT